MIHPWITSVILPHGIQFFFNSIYDDHDFSLRERLSHPQAAVFKGQVNADVAAAVRFSYGDADFKGFAAKLAGADVFTALFNRTTDAFDGVNH